MDDKEKVAWLEKENKRLVEEVDKLKRDNAILKSKLKIAQLKLVEVGAY